MKTTMAIIATGLLSSLAAVPLAVASGPAAPVQAPGPWRDAEVVEVDAGTDLEATVARLVREARTPMWIAYEVEAVSAGVGSCCYRDGAHGAGAGVCLLEPERGAGFTIAEDGDPSDSPPRVRILLRAANGRVGQVRAFASDCTLDAGGRRVVSLGGVDLEDSLDLLVDMTEGRGESGELTASAEESSLVAAVAVHGGDEPNEHLARWARGPASERREPAIFWLGAARERPGVAILTGLLAESPEPGIREKAVFALYVSERPERVDLLIGAARQDPSAEVRSQAVFWLAQLAGERAVAAVEGAVSRDPDLEVRKQAVFALSQLPPDRGLPLLIRIARTHPEAEIRKQAIFWIGQSDDARALDFIEELLQG